MQEGRNAVSGAEVLRARVSDMLTFPEGKGRKGRTNN